ncbi:hypothetical protein EDB80DRAFT_693490 [Ilyonectria destructans]|nr:hypothetical protein EDB80DRAFT_693490 [Ilyonectria destructans]
MRAQAHVVICLIGKYAGFLHGVYFDIACRALTEIGGQGKWGQDVSLLAVTLLYAACVGLYQPSQFDLPNVGHTTIKKTYGVRSGWNCRATTADSSKSYWMLLRSASYGLCLRLCLSPYIPRAMRDSLRSMLSRGGYRHIQLLFLP